MVSGRRRTAQATVERAAATAERPLRRAVGSARANPLPHAGTISVFLLVVVVLTGVYITLFFEYGFGASYEAVARLQAHPIQRVMRAIHRFASAALVLTTVVHAWRTFVAGRFSGGRRFRWLTGLLALVLVWLAGLSGYWLVWDQRAQAIAEAVSAVIGRFGPGAALSASWTGEGAGSGATLMVVVWFVHLGLTAVIGWALWRHVRRTRLGWWPPRHWMALAFGGLVLAAVLLPLGMLDPADFSTPLPALSLDPFVLFLVPPLLSGAAGWVALGGIVVLVAAAAVPWLLRATAVDVVEIDADRCTGCDLCVQDCPYLALRLDDRADGPAVAVVDADACVGCGICLGSCAFGAMSLGELDAAAALDDIEVDGRDVVVACRRHLAQHDLDDLDAVVVEVPCSGAFPPHSVADLVRRGAGDVQLLGCAPGECAYGIGNELAHARLAGDRAPHVARRFAGVAKEDWVALGDAPRSTLEPGAHPDLDADHLPAALRSRVASGVVVVGSVLVVALLTLIPWRGEGDEPGVRVVVDHTAGQRLEGQAEAAGAAGDATTVAVEVDGDEVARRTLPTWRGAAVGVVDAPASVGDRHVRVLLVHDGRETVVLDDQVDLQAGRRLLVEARDAPPPPGASRGRTVFTDPDLGACTVCHSTKAGEERVGPSLAGVATRAETAVPGLDARGYLRQSILDPDAVIAPGFRAGQMLDIYEERLSAEDLESLIDYLLTLEDG